MWFGLAGWFVESNLKRAARPNERELEWTSDNKRTSVAVCSRRSQMFTSTLDYFRADPSMFQISSHLGWPNVFKEFRTPVALMASLYMIQNVLVRSLLKFTYVGLVRLLEANDKDQEQMSDYNNILKLICSNNMCPDWWYIVLYSDLDIYKQSIKNSVVKVLRSNMSTEMPKLPRFKENYDNFHCHCQRFL